MKRPTLALLLGALFALAGCDIVPPPQADLTRYYVLTAEPTAAEPAAGAGLRVGLKSVELPAYLKNADIVVRRGANEIVRQDAARWGEPLDAGIARAVRAQLRAAPGVGRVYPQPFPLDADRDYDVAIEIIRCEGVGGGSPRVRFAAAIEISTAGNDPRVVARKMFAAPDAPWDGRDFGRLAAALSEAASALGREAAAALPSAPPAK